MAKIIYATSGSADKHEIPHADAEQAVRNHRYWVREFDEPRAPGSSRPDLFIGPDNPGDVLLEVMGNWLVGGDFEVFHVMPLRDKTRDLVRRIHAERTR
ncbi:MAG: hypothetical protein ABI435_08385 [Pseudolysinimonas sp.]